MTEKGPVRQPVVVLVLAVLLAGGVLVSVVSVVPGVRTTPGFLPIVDGWIKSATYVLIALLVALRAVLRDDDRPAWSWLAAGYLMQAVGFASWLGWVRWLDPVPYPSVADAGWLLSAPAFLVGLVLLVRSRWPRRSLAVLLDAVAAAAVAASITVAVLSGAVVWGQRVDGAEAVVALAYPLLDIAVLTVIAALLAGLGTQWRSATVAWLAVSMIGMSAVDVIFALQTAAGTFRPASLLSGLSVAATAAGVVAAWLPERDAAGTEPTALPGLRVPALIGAGAVGILAAGGWLELAGVSTLLAVLGLLLLAGRVALTFRVAREVGSLRRAQQVARLGSWVSDASRVGRDWADATVALLGLSPTAATDSDGGAAFEPLVVDEDREAVLAALRKAEQTGRIDVTYRVRNAGGSTRTLRARAQADLDRRGRPGSWVGTLQDVTEQHHLAAALAESDAMLRRVLAATNDGWWTLDLRTGDAVISDRWWELHGYLPQGSPTSGPPWRQVTSPEVAAQVEAELNQAVSERRPSASVDLVSRHLDGHDLPIVLRMLLEYDAAGELIRLSAAATDLTDARRAEAAKDALIAAVSHELRTPLTPIVGFSELLRRSSDLTDGQVQAVAAIERNATHLAALVDALLDASRAHQLPEEPQPEMVELGEHIRTLLIDRRDAEVDLTAPDTPVAASVDPTHLTRILNNLLDNASRHGEPPIEIHLEHEMAHATITVSDRGPGVPAWFIPELFTDFAQATSGDQRPTLGLGLGLAIARRLAEANGGALDYIPTASRTAFALRLAAVPPEQPPPPGPASTHHGRHRPADRSEA